MIIAVLTLWFGFTNHLIRGVDEPDTYGWPKWTGYLLGKYPWCVYSGGIVYAALLMSGASHLWHVALIITGGLAIWCAPGAEFTVLHKPSWKTFLAALQRNLLVLPLFAVLALSLSTWQGVLAGFTSVLLYALIPLLLSFIYTNKTTWAQGMNETLYGLFGLGLPIGLLINAAN